MKENLNDLRGFLLAAQTGSFTKAAAQLGISPSALSHSIKGLEARLGVKLLNRTTRSTATTDAGEQLYRRLLPLLEDMQDALDALGTFSGSLKGRLKINATEHALNLLWPKFSAFMRQYPDVELELCADIRFVDIVGERFDAGIRLGGDVEKDMIAVRVADELRACVIASPAYLAAHGTPASPHELGKHRCAAIRLPTSGGLLAWEFCDPHSGKTVKALPDGGFTANNSRLTLSFALSGHGLAWLPQDIAADALADGRLQEVLPDWAMRYDGYHLYYPNRRADSPLFQALVAALRHVQN